jgi:hypothetical protein
MGNFANERAVMTHTQQTGPDSRVPRLGGSEAYPAFGSANPTSSRPPWARPGCYASRDGGMERGMGTLGASAGAGVAGAGEAHAGPHDGGGRLRA